MYLGKSQGEFLIQISSINLCLSVDAGELQGPGGGMDDLIQTSIEGKRAAAVSPQEFVVPRDIVAELGQGSYDKGSNKLYALMRNVRKTKTGTTKQPAELTRGLGQLMRTAIG